MKWIRSVLPPMLMACAACAVVMAYAVPRAHADEVAAQAEPTPAALAPIDSLEITSTADPRLEHGARSLTLRDRIFVEALREHAPEVAAYRERSTLYLANVGLPAMQVRHLSDCAVNSRFESNQELTLANLTAEQSQMLKRACVTWARVRHAAAAGIDCKVSQVGTSTLDVTFDPSTVAASLSASRPLSVALASD